QEWHEKQRKQYCHDTHAIHGDPLALMDAGRSALAVASLVGEDRLQITFLEALRLTAHNKESSCARGARAPELNTPWDPHCRALPSGGFGDAIANSKGRAVGARPFSGPLVTSQLDRANLRIGK